MPRQSNSPRSISSPTIWRAALFCSGIGGAFLVTGLLLKPPAAFTWSLWAVVAVTAAGTLAALAGGIFFPRLRPLYHRLSAFRRVSLLARLLPVVTLLIAWLGLLWPQGRIAGLDAYLIRLQPLLGWLAISAFAALVALLLTSRQPFSPVDRQFWLAWAVFLGLAALLWLLAALTGLGVRVSSGFWNKAAVPLTGLQLFGLIIAGLWADLTPALRRARSRWLDAALFLLIWGLAAWAWTLQPAPSSTFSSDAWLPNLANYPSSDAATFDLMGQSILIGEGIRTSIDKPLYLALRALFNLACGSAYPCVNQLQAAFLALIPAVLYLLGRRLNSRGFGLMLAGAAVFKELNGQALTNLIQLTNAQEAMTELPTLLLLAVFTLLLAAWLRAPERILDWRLLAAGGALGLAGLIRLNAFTILPFALLLVALSAGHARGRWWKAPALFSLIFLLAWLPWMIRCQIVEGNAFAFVNTKTSGVILKNRYNPILQESNPAPSGTAAPAAIPTNAQMPTVESDNSGFAGLVFSIVNHYAHNLIASAFVIPPDPRHYAVAAYYRLPYWQLNWNGRLAALDAASLVLNLLLLTGGIALAWRRQGWAGLTPLAVLLGYTAASAASLTSGGRYLQPADWVIYFYHLFALWYLAAAVLVRLGLAPLGSALPAHSHAVVSTGGLAWRAPFAAVLLTLCLGFLPAGLERTFPVRYPLPDASRLAETLEENQDIQRWLTSDPQAVLIGGRMLYPRYYPADQGDNRVESHTPFSAKPYPHLVFWLLNRERIPVVLPLADPPADLPNASDAVVLGCREKDRIQALAVWRLRPTSGTDGETIEPLALPPQGPLRCPLTVP